MRTLLRPLHFLEITQPYLADRATSVPVLDRCPQHLSSNCSESRNWSPSTRLLVLRRRMVDGLDAETYFGSCGNDVGDVRGLCSARRPNGMPPCEVALGFGLDEGFSQDEVPTLP